MSQSPPFNVPELTKKSLGYWGSTTNLNYSVIYNGLKIWNRTKILGYHWSSFKTVSKRRCFFSLSFFNGSLRLMVAVIFSPLAAFLDFLLHSFLGPHLNRSPLVLGCGRRVSFVFMFDLVECSSVAKKRRFKTKLAKQTHWMQLVIATPCWLAKNRRKRSQATI